MSVILVDRLLDLASATMCSSENLYDRLLHTLERLHEYSNDVAINMTTEAQGDLTTAAGCLAPQTNWNDGLEMMDHLFHKTEEQATQWITAMLKSSLEDSDDLDELADLISHYNQNWDCIETFTHLYQVDYFVFLPITVAFKVSVIFR